MVAVIVTVLNEEKTVLPLLEALKSQSLQADEIIIADGGSKDKTREIVKGFDKLNKQLNIRIISAVGNRALSRNKAIKKTSEKLIAITDAGCQPQKNWLRNLVNKQRSSKADVIAGYYKGIVTNNLSEAIIAYTLVLPNKLNKHNFLPATRSMLITKKTWNSINGFNENLNSSEDFDFAKRLQKNHCSIYFAKNAIVNWQPRTTLISFAKMVFDFAKWDIIALNIRPKVLLIIARYLFLAIFFYLTDNILIILLVGITYALWSIRKNYSNVKNGWYWLPILQIISDFAVIAGSMTGALTKTIRLIKNY